MSYEIKDSGTRENFDTGAVRDIQENKGRFDLIPPETLTALAVHYEKGCKKYGDRNWEKGIPVNIFLNSAMRHLVKTIKGMRDENHLISAIWNLFCAYETILRIQKGKLPRGLYTMPGTVTLPVELNEPITTIEKMQDQEFEDYYDSIGCVNCDETSAPISAECCHPESMRMIRTSTGDGKTYAVCACGKIIEEI